MTCAVGIFLQETFVRLLSSCILRHFSRVIMEQGYVFRGNLRWVSTWRDNKTDDPDRSIEFMDIGLLETGDNMHVLMRNGKVQENSAWAYVKLKDDQHRLALKLSTSDKPNDFRYYGFHWSVMTMDGQAGYLCQDSTKAEDNTKFTVDTYMEMFLRKDYKKEQKYHITLMRTETQFAEVEKRRRRRIYTGGVEIDLKAEYAENVAEEDRSFDIWIKHGDVRWHQAPTGEPMQITICLQKQLEAHGVTFKPMGTHLTIGEVPEGCSKEEADETKNKISQMICDNHAEGKWHKCIFEKWGRHSVLLKGELAEACREIRHKLGPQLLRPIVIGEIERPLHVELVPMKKNGVYEEEDPEDPTPYRRKMQQNASHDAAMKRAYSPSLVHLYSVGRGGRLFATGAVMREIENSQCEILGSLDARCAGAVMREIGNEQCKVLVSLDARCGHCTSDSIFTCTACNDMFCAWHLAKLLQCQLRCGCQV